MRKEFGTGIGVPGTVVIIQGDVDVNPHNSSALLLLNNAKSEKEILGKCSRYEIRSILRKYSLLVRDGKMKRIIVKGMPYYVPILTDVMERETELINRMV